MAEPDWIEVSLVPVEVFGEDDCCEHGIGDDTCPSRGYGLADAVAPWSDCNRAVGHIYRFQDLQATRGWHRGDSLRVRVRRDEYEAFSARRFGTG